VDSAGLCMVADTPSSMDRHGDDDEEEAMPVPEELEGGRRVKAPGLDTRSGLVAHPKQLQRRPSAVPSASAPSLGFFIASPGKTSDSSAVGDGIFEGHCGSPASWRLSGPRLPGRVAQRGPRLSAGDTAPASVSCPGSPAPGPGGPGDVSVAPAALPGSPTLHPPRPELIDGAFLATASTSGGGGGGGGASSSSPSRSSPGRTLSGEGCMKNPLAAASLEVTSGLLAHEASEVDDLEAFGLRVGMLPMSAPKVGRRLEDNLPLHSAAMGDDVAIPAAREGAFDGIWMHRLSGEARSEVIYGDQISWHDGGVTKFIIQDDGSLCVPLQGRHGIARLVEKYLVWETGEVWTRMHSRSNDVVPAFDAGIAVSSAPSSWGAAVAAGREGVAMDEAMDVESFLEDELMFMVPSDEDGRPQPPYPARIAQTMLLDDYPQEEELAPMTVQAIQEEEEWLARKRLTGAVGRLVRYKEGLRPADDILGLRLTRHGRIMVTALQKDGPASKAGVSTGDQLASINGKRLFGGGSVSRILANVVGPVTLVFLGFAGKLQAEVRVRQPDQPSCGMPNGTEIVLHSVTTPVPPIRLTEAVVFTRQPTSLFIATASPRDEPPSDMALRDVSVRGSEQLFDVGGSLHGNVLAGETACQTSVTSPTYRPPLSSGAAASREEVDDEGEDVSTGLYELQRDDAKRILKKVLKTSKTALCTV